MEDSVSVQQQATDSQRSSTVPAVDYASVERGQQQSVRLKEYLLEHILDNMVESVIITNKQGLIVRVNSAFSKITGYSAEEALGQSARFIQSDHHDELFHRQMWQQINDTGRWYGQIWNRRKSGEVYLQHLNINSLTNSQGQVTHMIGLGQDLTDAEKPEEISSFLL